MTTLEKRMSVVAGGAFILLVVLQIILPKPIDWTESFEAGDTRPYGSRLLYQTLDAVAPEADIEPVEVSPYLKLQEIDASTGTAYLFIADTFDPDPQETEQLLTYAARGNTIYIAAEDLTGPLADTLGVDMRSLGYFGLARADTAAYDSLQFDGLPAADDIRLTRTNTVQSDIYEYDENRVRPLAFIHPSSGSSSWSFRRGDTHGDRSLVMVGSAVGEGRVIVSSFPRVFSNVNLVDSVSAPAAYTALSHIPASASTVYWDTRHKPLVTEARTPLRFLINTPTLRTALYLGVFGLVTLFVVGVRRRQRAIPVVEPPSNETLSFVRTVGELYYREGDNAQLAERKISYFQTYLRTHLGLSLDDLDAAREEHADDMAASIARRSGVDRASVDDLLDRIRSAGRASSMEDAELRALANAINAFYRNSER